MAPKHTFNSAKITEICAFISACVYNEGFSSVLKIMDVMGIKLGLVCSAYAQQRNAERISRAEERHTFASKEARTAQRMEASDQQSMYEEVEGLLYNPGGF